MTSPRQWATVPVWHLHPALLPDRSDGIWDRTIEFRDDVYVAVDGAIGLAIRAELVTYTLKYEQLRRPPW
jgi:hypothetical protein